MMKCLRLAPLMTCVALPAVADVPNVVTDFGPTNAILTQVMAGVGIPTPMLSAQDTPHSFAMRPSHAQILSDADLVVWVGADLTPWLAEPIENLAADATLLTLLDTEGWDILEARSIHSHGSAHDDHDANAHDDDHGHDDHDDAHDHAADHADDHATQGAHDPHAWLDPDIAAIWALAAADALSIADPENAVIYQANANQFWADAALLGQEITVQLSEIDGSTLLFPHDSTQYFETRFALAPAGFISQSDAAAAGPAHIRDLRDRIEAGEITCVLSDLETSPGTINTLTEGTGAQTAFLDMTDSAGAGYLAMLRSIADALATCAD